MTYIFVLLEASAALRPRPCQKTIRNLLAIRSFQAQSGRECASKMRRALSVDADTNIDKILGSCLSAAVPFCTRVTVSVKAVKLRASRVLAAYSGIDFSPPSRVIGQPGYIWYQ
jgi:hypothetical protein